MVLTAGPLSPGLPVWPPGFDIKLSGDDTRMQAASSRAPSAAAIQPGLLLPPPAPPVQPWQRMEGEGVGLEVVQVGAFVSGRGGLKTAKSG